MTGRCPRCAAPLWGVMSTLHLVLVLPCHHWLAPGELHKVGGRS